MHLMHSRLVLGSRRVILQDKFILWSPKAVFTLFVLLDHDQFGCSGDRSHVHGSQVRHITHLDSRVGTVLLAGNIYAIYVMAKIHYFIQQDWTSKLSTIEDQFQSCSVEQSTGGDIKVSLLDKSSPNSGDIAATIPRKSSFQSFSSLLRLFRTKQTSDWRGNNEGSKVFPRSGEVLSWRPKCNFLHWCIFNVIYKSFIVVGMDTL